MCGLRVNINFSHLHFLFGELLDVNLNLEPEISFWEFLIESLFKENRIKYTSFLVSIIAVLPLLYLSWLFGNPRKSDIIPFRQPEAVKAFSYRLGSGFAGNWNNLAKSESQNIDTKTYGFARTDFNRSNLAHVATKATPNSDKIQPLSETDQPSTSSLTAKNSPLATDEQLTIASQKQKEFEKQREYSHTRKYTPIMRAKSIAYVWSTATQSLTPEQCEAMIKLREPLNVVFDQGMRNVQLILKKQDHFDELMTTYETCQTAEKNFHETTFLPAKANLDTFVGSQKARKEAANHFKKIKSQSIEYTKEANQAFTAAMKYDQNHIVPAKNALQKIETCIINEVEDKLEEILNPSSITEKTLKGKTQRQKTNAALINRIKRRNTAFNNHDNNIINSFHGPSSFEQISIYYNLPIDRSFQKMVQKQLEKIKVLPN